MSAVNIQMKCIICSTLFDRSILETHAKSHTGPAVPRAQANGKSLSDYLFVKLYSTSVSGSNQTAATIGKAVLPMANAVTAMGITKRSLDASISGLLGAGGEITEQGMVNIFSRLQADLGKFDPSSFTLSYAHWMILTNGSPKETDAGVMVVRPDKSAGASAKPIDIPYHKLINLLMDYGHDMNMTVTPRKFYCVRSFYKQCLDLYASHPVFASMRADGTKFSNQCGIPPNLFYQGNPCYQTMVSSSTMTDLEIKYAANVRKIATVDVATDEPIISTFDPTHSNYNIPLATSSAKSPDDQLASNIGKKGLVSSLMNTPP